MGQRLTDFNDFDNYFRNKKLIKQTVVMLID